MNNSQDNTGEGSFVDAVIIGGGITGMAAAYYLQEAARAAGRPLAYVLVESNTRLGGKIATEHVDGFTIEGGPDCFISQKPWAAELCRKLGLGEELIGTNDERRKTFVLNHGRLTPLPDGVLLIVPTRFTPFVTSTLISWPGKIRMGMDLLIPRRKDNADESVASFVRRRLGREALDKIAEPLMGGIHVSDPEQQSLLGTFPRFRDLEMKHRSLILGMLASRRTGPHSGHGDHDNHGGHNGTAPAASGGPQASPRPSSLFMTLRGGLGQMVATLEKALAGQIITGTSVVSLDWMEAAPDEPRYRVRTSDGRTLYSRAVVLATPSYVSGKLVTSLDATLGDALAAIRYVSTGTVSLGYRRADVKHPLNGFGLVIPRHEGRKISACTWTSTKFNHRAPDDGVLVRCFVGGPGHEEMVDLDDEELLAVARQELQQIMGVDAQPVVWRIFRWHKANPQYDVDHLERVHAMRERCQAQPGLYIAGSAFDGVGVPDCIRQGQAAAKGAWAFLEESHSQEVVLCQDCAI